MVNSVLLKNARIILENDVIQLGYLYMVKLF